MPTLLVYAYSIESSNQVFSHQLEVISKVAAIFDKVKVVVPLKNNQMSTSTSELNDGFKSKIEVIGVKHVSGQSIRNILRILGVTIALLTRGRINAVFFFMTESYAAIAGPLFWMLRVPRVLWYAHISKPLRLVFASLFMNLICTSTRGSITLHSSKIRYIGQMVDERLFPHQGLNRDHLVNLIHVGRFDPSKGITTIIETFIEVEKNFPNLTLRIIGSPTSESGKMLLHQIELKYQNYIRLKKIVLMPAVERSLLVEVFKNAGIFVHAFQGSLDKTVIEATLSGIPVVTINDQYIREFGCWGANPNSLSTQIYSIFEMQESELSSELIKRRKHALSEHSLTQWVSKLVEVFHKEGIIH